MAMADRRPELLAPAGDFDCVRAAIENGADAVYFGLDAGFNARARAPNFSVESLPELMRTLHLRGLKGYAALNTLVPAVRLSTPDAPPSSAITLASVPELVRM